MSPNNNTRILKNLTMPGKKLTKLQLALVIVAAVLVGFVIVAVGVSFYPFKLSSKDTLKLYQMMKDVDEVMRANNVPYIAESGTLLGSVRHGGLIPWDDDLDIQVLKENEASFLWHWPPFFIRWITTSVKQSLGTAFNPKAAKPWLFRFATCLSLRLTTKTNRTMKITLLKNVYF
jgi:hypothetical protein